MFIKRLIIILLLVQGILKLSLSQEIWPTEEWPRSEPAEQQLNAKTLTTLIEKIREGEEYPNQHSLLIVRNGYLIVEEYFNDYNAEKIHTLQSVSKSFTSAVMGIAIEQGSLIGVEEKVLDFFADVNNIKNKNDLKAEIKLKDLLTMRSGTDYHEGYYSSPHSQLNRLDKGWDKFYLNRPMNYKPGTRFQYDSGGVILMSAMLRNRTGKHVDVFAEQYLFAPLGIKKSHWFKNNEGHPHTGGGLHLRPIDMAKFGLLYLRNGKWENKQIVSKWWVEESFKKRVTFSGYRSRREIGYGYLWWIQEPDPQGSGKHNIYSARGAYGQFIFIIPEHNMVVVVTGDTRGRDFKKPIDFLYSHILPAVHH